MVWASAASISKLRAATVCRSSRFCGTTVPGAELRGNAIPERLNRFSYCSSAASWGRLLPFLVVERALIRRSFRNRLFRNSRAYRQVREHRLKGATYPGPILPKDLIVLLIRSSIRLLKREGPMPLALFSLGAEPTEQKVFKRSNRQAESLSRRTRVLLSFILWNAKQRHPNGMRRFYSKPCRHRAGANKHKSSP